MTEPELIESTLEPSGREEAPPPFLSILARDGRKAEAETPPACFHDLNLDQVVEAIVAGRDEYALRPFFFRLLGDPDDVLYRQEVFRDLERGEVRDAVASFAGEMRRARSYLALAQKASYELAKQRWHVDAAAVYCDAVGALHAALGSTGVRSRGLRGLRAYLDGYVASEAFADMAGDARSVLDALGELRFTVRIRQSRVTVSAYEGEPDFSEEIERTFARFRRSAAESHLFAIPDSRSMSHIDARIVERVQRLFPAPFAALEAFSRRYPDCFDGPIARFDREVQFYLAYLEHAERLSARGLPFSYPQVERTREVFAEDAFDLALAGKLTAAGERVIRNEFALAGPERVLVVTGPNQGGKTTFARMFGQLHVLAALGVPVPARRARLALPDAVFTHFEREEDLATLRGKLEDDLVRVREILEAATEESVLVVNEIFSSTTLADAALLGSEVLRRIERLGCLAVLVTFVDELASHSVATVSMVAGVSPDDPSRRTFRIERRPADGRAYALALAEKYRLSYDSLRRRLGR